MQDLEFLTLLAPVISIALILAVFVITFNLIQIRKELQKQSRYMEKQWGITPEPEGPII